MWSAGATPSCLLAVLVVASNFPGTSRAFELLVNENDHTAGTKKKLELQKVHVQVHQKERKSPSFAAFAKKMKNETSTTDAVVDEDSPKRMFLPSPSQTTEESLLERNNAGKRKRKTTSIVRKNPPSPYQKCTPQKICNAKW